MRLTNFQKEGIVRAIMQDVPKPNHRKLAEEMQAALVAAMSEPVRAVLKEQPAALRTTRLYSSDYELDYSTEFIIADVKYEQVLKPWRDARKARREAELALKGVVMACNTLKQLKERLPECIKYFPTEAEPTKNLPALANVMADLSKLGWPKGAAA